jgi:hypothetical protein
MEFIDLFTDVLCITDDIWYNPSSFLHYARYAKPAMSAAQTDPRAGEE